LRTIVPALTVAGFRALVRLRRYRELGLLAIATLVGCLAGVVVTFMSWVTNLAHRLLFLLPSGERLSEQVSLTHPALALVPVAGGVVLAVLAYLTRRRFTRPPVDPIEANALYGGRMSVPESLLVAVQTMISSGFGASVGLEAGYTQASAGFASSPRPSASGAATSARWSAAPPPAPFPPPSTRRSPAPSMASS